MAVELASEIWAELKRYVNSVDRNEAAETIVNILIDNDVDADDIKSAFKGDGDIKRALADYLKEEEDLEEEEEDSYDDDDDY
jgi:hypothetical protein